LQCHSLLYPFPRVRMTATVVGKMASQLFLWHPRFGGGGGERQDL
jgi:hypothetical protein